MRTKTIAALALLTLTAPALSACGGVAETIGLKKVVPDEFLTVTSAPLTVPPEYGLIPPAPGQARPQELAPDSAISIGVVLLILDSILVERRAKSLIG